MMADRNICLLNSHKAFSDIIFAENAFSTKQEQEDMLNSRVRLFEGFIISCAQNLMGGGGKC